MCIFNSRYHIIYEHPLWNLLVYGSTNLTFSTFRIKIENLSSFKCIPTEQKNLIKNINKINNFYSNKIWCMVYCKVMFFSWLIDFALPVSHIEWQYLTSYQCLNFIKSDQFMFYFFPDRQTPIFLNEICKLSN